MLKNDRWISNTRTINQYLQAPSFRRALRVSDKAKLQVQVGHYKKLSEKKIDALPFQERAVREACKRQSGLWSGELWTGAGKSIVAAKIALRFLRHGGKVIFICPNRMGLGNESDGIIQKFHRVFEQYCPGKYQIGRLGQTSDLNDVHFMTPYGFVSLQRESPNLFLKLVGSSSLLIVDEVHHFPEDPKEEQVIYGKVERIGKRYFLEAGKKVVTLTATFGRTDGKPVFGKNDIDFRITVYEAVQMGFCPKIHGLQTFLKTRAPKAVRKGSDYDLHLNRKRRLQYFREVVGTMIQVEQRNPGAQFCAFVKRTQEAKKVAEIWNREAKHRGWAPIAVLTSNVPYSERSQIKEDLKSKKYVGYVTCDVGSESIDIPPLEIVHLIRRSCSTIKLVQSIGRALRLSIGKRRALVVDYHVQEARIIRACKGLEEYASAVGMPPWHSPVNGGSLFPEGGSKNADLDGISISSEKAWVLKQLTHKEANYKWKSLLIELARKGKPRPRNGTTLSMSLNAYTSRNSCSFDQKLFDKLKELSPQWFLYWRKLQLENYKETLLSMALKKVPRPNHKTSLGKHLSIFTRNGWGYGFDPSFNQKIRTTTPEWFSEERQERMEMSKQKLLDIANRGLEKPHRTSLLGRWLTYFVSRSNNGYDLSFDKAIRTKRPDWFRGGNQMIIERQKRELFELAKNGKPRPNKKTVLGKRLERLSHKEDGRSHRLFINRLKEVCPWWFRKESLQNCKNQLIVLAKNGGPKPHYRTYLGRRLGRLIHKGQSSTDPVFCPLHSETCSTVV